MRYFVLTALLLLAAGSSFAETRYVSDELTITLRAGQGNAYKILQTLRSGEQLQILEEDGEFIRVRTNRDLEGWVRSRYLTDAPIARARLTAAEQKLARLEGEARSLREQASSLQAERNSLRDKLRATETEKASLEDEAAELKQIAAEPLQLREKNRVMKSRIDTLESDLARIERTNDQLRNNSQREWFMVGAGVLGAGIFLGLVLPLIRRKSRSSSWSDLR
ncbi:TIGR04211 family SH3 domain-containing protein [Thiohalomonas denitrificans]|uniref:SH3 domain protein n=1 Tax=Thiohalomonas denitrificans TaxID=415747 RepID=A0A1G5PVN3_9GAMM|nr:TIGR04211 family SH3 domain-containing protein [Thiohalomonas denitrificans]SCZ53468.1 SH3 domain protein [Thiohalomonas denitrificans]